jgi:quercetin dioxygenase-like cupin family protein
MLLITPSAAALFLPAPGRYTFAITILGKHMIWRPVLAAAVASLLATPVFGAETFKYLTGEEAHALTANIKDGIAASVLYNKGFYLQQLVERTASAPVETHAEWTDHIVVLDGEATMIIGGTVPDDHESGPGERRGTHSIGGKEYRMAKDVMITVPAGTPHWTVLKPGQHVRWVVFKIKE